MYPTLMLNFKKPRAFMSLSIILYEFRNLLVLFDTSFDTFLCLEAEFHQIFQVT